MPLKLGNAVDTPELSTLETLGGSLVTGARRDPLLRPAIDAAATVFGSDSKQLDELEQRLQETSLGRTATTVSEYATQVGLAVGFGGLGRAAVYGVVRAAAPRLALREAGTFLAGQGERIAGRLASEQALATGVGEVAAAGPITGLERAAQIAGLSAGEGLLGGSQAAARGEDAAGIVSGAALNAALAGGGELALLGAARALGAVPALSLTRGLDVPAARANAEPAREAIRATIARGESRVTALRDELETVLGVRNLEAETLAALRFQARAAESAVRSLREQGSNVSRAEVFEAAGIRTGREIARGRTLERQASRQERVNAALGEFDRTIDFLPDDRILRTRPVSPRDETRLGLRAVLQRMVEAPEAAAGKLGVVATKLVSDVSSIEELLPAAYAAIDQQTLRLTGQLARALGREAPASLRRADTLFSDVFEAAERGGLEEVGARFGPEARATMEAFTRANDEAFAPFVQRGVAARLTPEQLQQLGVRAYFPQVLSDGDLVGAENSLTQYLTRRLGDPLEAQRGARRVVRSVGQFGSLDYQRFLPGTLAEKVAEGLPFEGYVSGIAQYQRRLARRAMYGERFGFTDQEITRFTDVIKTASTQEGANIRLVSSLVDSLFDRKYELAAGRRLAQNITSVQTAVKLPLATLTNMSQSVSTAVAFGMKNLMRGVRAAVGAERDDVVLRALAFSDSVEMDTMRRLIAGVENESLADRVASGVLRATGFNATEQWNRRFAGFTTQASINDTLARALRGRLRGTSLDAARRSFQQLGLDLDRMLAGPSRQAVNDALAAGRDLSGVVDATLGVGSYARAIVRGVDYSQALPQRTRIPLAWQTPLGRVLTQFKSFSFNQGRFLRDRVLGEAAAGNLRPLVTMASVYPIAGELVASSLNFVKGKERDEDGLSRLVTNISMLGGFGLAQSAATGAKYGRLSDVLVGPSLSDALSFAEGAMQLITEQESAPLLKQASRQPAVTAVKSILGGGAAVASYLDDYIGADDGSDAGVVPLESWTKRMVGTYSE